MRSQEHHTKSPKKSQHGKALNLQHPKWTPNLYIYIAVYWRLDGLFELFKSVERCFLTQEGIWDGISLITRMAN